MPKSSSNLNEDEILDYLATHHPELADALVDETVSGQVEEVDSDDEDVILPASGQLVPDIPNFKLRRVIGRGGFGTVWLARNVHDHHLYAVKVLGENRSTELAGIREFKSRAASNPFLVSISHVGEANGIYYYVMPLADDITENHVVEIDAYQPMTLSAFVRRSGGMEAERIERIVTRLLLGLERLHETGLSHNDIKPSNILRVAGTWQLGDPGLMTAVAHRKNGRGTREYWPEQDDADGKECDLYALGKTMQFMLAGGLDKPIPTNPQSKLHNRIAKCILVAGDPKSGNRFRSVNAMRSVLAAPNQRYFWAAAGAVLLVAASLIGFWGLRSPSQTPHANVLLPFDVENAKQLAAFDTQGTTKNVTKLLDPTEPLEGLKVFPMTIGPGLSKTIINISNRFAPSDVVCESLMEAIEEAKYLSFKIEVEDGASLDLQAIEAFLYSQDRIPRNFALLSSVHGFTTDATLSKFDGPVIGPKKYGQELRLADLRKFDEFRKLDGAIEFRIYMYGLSGSEFVISGLGDSEGYELTLFGELQGTEAQFVDGP